MFDWITIPEAWVALATLTALEIVLGIDNIIFISILSGRLPKEQRPRARTLGLAGAMIMRVGLLLSLAWVAKLTVEIFTLFGDPFTARDVVLVGVSDGVEVWDAGAWDKQLAESLDNIEETARKLSKEPAE